MKRFNKEHELARNFLSTRTEVWEEVPLIASGPAICVTITAHRHFTDSQCLT